MIPSSRALLSRDKRLPLDTWNQSGVQENVFEINFLRLIHLEIFFKEFNLTTCEETEKQALKPGRTKTIHTSEDRQNQGTSPISTFARRPLTTSATIAVEVPQNCVVGQQRQQISECQFDKFPNPSSFVVWKTRFKTQVSNGSEFPSEAMLWIEKVERLILWMS